MTSFLYVSENKEKVGPHTGQRQIQHIMMEKGLSILTYLAAVEYAYISYMFIQRQVIPVVNKQNVFSCNSFFNFGLKFCLIYLLHASWI